MPLLPGFRSANNRVITHVMLDVFLWLPTTEGLVVFDDNCCRMHRVRYHQREKLYYKYTLVFLDQVSKRLSPVIYHSLISDRMSIPKDGVRTLFANALPVAIES